MDRARTSLEKGKTSQSWAFLERAHILSQPYAWPHVATHLEMLRVALLARDGKEFVGQVLRTLIAAPGSILKRYPEGNTGRANVSMFLPMPAPRDLFESIPLEEEETRG